MSTTTIPADAIYTGLWTDWTHGRIQGWTLTLSSRSGAYLIAFLAIFVRLAGGQLWDILCYILFQTRSTRRPKDGLFWQQQALLANKPSDGRAMFRFSALALAWRRKAARPMWRTMPLILTAVVHFILFVLAGVFSSRVTQSHSNVLLRSLYCGPQMYPRNVKELAESEANVVPTLMAASAYATECHTFNSSETTSGSMSCDAFGRRQIQWSLETGAKCPFADDMCLDGQAIVIDSGYIDSHEDLGINGPRDRRLKWRTVGTLFSSIILYD